MRSRRLGRTGIHVGEIGLGTEYLNGLPSETVVPLVREALDRGVVYIDLFFAHPGLRDQVGQALQGRRGEVVVAGHLGSVLRGGQYQKSRDAEASERYLHDLLERLRTDYIDVLMLHFVDLPEEYERVFHGGPLDMAKRFQREGKARFIGMSGHAPETSLRAVRSGEIDVLMYPINVTGHGIQEKERLLDACLDNDVGLVAMKPFAGGKLFQTGHDASMGHVHTGGKILSSRLRTPPTAGQCLRYVLAEKAVSTVVPGVKSRDELMEALAAAEAGAGDDRRFLESLTEGAFQSAGCVYCNHCLPCPAHIDIGQVIRLADIGQYSVSEDLQGAYVALGAKASECTECGACTERCPFGVDAMASVKRSAALYERS